MKITHLNGDALNGERIVEIRASYQFVKPILRKEYNITYVKQKGPCVTVHRENSGTSFVTVKINLQLNKTVPLHQAIFKTFKRENTGSFSRIKIGT